jgi:hypothetical protein
MRCQYLDNNDSQSFNIGVEVSAIWTSPQDER